MPLYPLLGGVVGVLGWALGMPALITWNASGITIKFNTAVCAALAGAALLALRLSRRPNPSRSASLSLG